MPRFVPVTCLLFLASLLLVVGTCPAAGRKKIAEKSDPAVSAVEKVLRGEVAGAVDRREQLADSLKQRSDLATARWQAGFIRDGSDWRSFDERARDTATTRILNEYRQRRDEAPKTFAGQVELANWCRKQGLEDHERVHLTVALSLAPADDRAAILNRLRCWKFGNQWVSERELVEWQNSNRRTLAALKNSGPKLEKIVEKLDGSPRQYELGMTSLKELATPDVIPAMEYILCGRNEVCALAAVDAMASADTWEATVTLAKQAAFSRWRSVRERATAALKARRFEDFVPPLVGLLATPVTGKFATTGFDFSLDCPYMPGGGGYVQLVMTSAFILARETDDQFQIAVLHTIDYRLNEVLQGRILSIDDAVVFGGPLYIASSSDRFDPLESPRAIASDLKLTRKVGEFDRAKADETYQGEKLVESINVRTEQLNRQVISVLASVTGLDPSPDPSTWWRWWADFSDLQQSAGKAVVVVSEDSEVKGDPSIWVRRISCFAAGTPVWTELGLQPIEAIQVGDRILAKDVETGELTYKPVLQTTVRPPKELTTLRFGDETIVCTGGHRFWQSGSGWIKARDLTEQTLLHTVTGNTPVWSAKKGSTAETYNLVVADFHTYFVGKTGVLCQDLLIPKGTNSVVPGLPRARAAAQN